MNFKKKLTLLRTNWMNLKKKKKNIKKQSNSQTNKKEVLN